MAVQGCRVEEQTWHNRGGDAKGEKSEGSFWEKDCWFGKSEWSVTTGKHCKFHYLSLLFILSLELLER